LEITRHEADRAELDALLASGILGRTNNLVRLLGFVCEKYFNGAFDEIKEYNIAVQALGRPPDFDPQADTIVRVTAHTLRKRLEDYYRTDGARHSIHICLPPGHYVPKFIHKEDLEAGVHAGRREANDFESLDEASSREYGFTPSPTASPQGSTLAHDALRVPGPGIRSMPSFRMLKVSAVVVVAACALSAFAWYRLNRATSPQGHDRSLPVAAPASGSGQTLRAMAGDGHGPYIDHAGATWESDSFCSGGTPFSVTGRTIQGTEDAQLFSAGRRGEFRCAYPVPPGIYEVHLLFAETSGLLENTRNVTFSINGGATTSLDVVDDAGGDDIATTKVFVDVKPQSDGMIHVDFTTPGSFFNAIEILPGAPHRTLPIRIMAGPSLYRDSNGNSWMPDRYFFGGRVNRFASELSKVPDGRLFEWHRYGHFHYAIPVEARGRYTVKLYFLEHWFGVQNGSVGGAGSRVFDVSCDGIMLLKSFDIFREAGTGPLVKTFNHIEPTPQGKIEIYFTPAVNYPSVSAIEIISE
jgi:hypothetical protein